jgi:hypothetical protein
VIASQNYSTGRREDFSLALASRAVTFPHTNAAATVTSRASATANFTTPTDCQKHKACP